MKRKTLRKLCQAVAIAAAAFIVGQLVGCSSAPREQYLYNRSVRILSPIGTCSGVQVHTAGGKDVILSAYHCRGLVQGNNFSVMDEDGNLYVEKAVDAIPEADLLMISGIVGLRGISVAPYQLRHEHIRTFTHGQGYTTYKTEGVLIESTVVDHSGHTSTLTISTAFVSAGSSGGTVVNDSGQLTGIVSCVDSKGYSYFVRLKAIQELVGRN